MEEKHNPQTLPEGLPVPADDGASDHLPGASIPHVPLISTAGEPVDLATLPGRTVVYCYPLTGRPDRELPQGWDEIPGARGCTPQSCAFRDHHEELRALGTRVFGLSTQDTAYQREAVERLHLPYELLSDEELGFAGLRDRQRLLPRVPARRERGGSHPVAAARTREGGQWIESKNG